jgi:hypothetical protein
MYARCGDMGEVTGVFDGDAGGGMEPTEYTFASVIRVCNLAVR